MEARQEYERHLTEAKQKIAELEGKLQTMVVVRAVLFFGSLGCLLFGYWGDVARSINVPLGWSLFAAFMVAIVWNEHLRLSHLSALNDSSLFVRLLARMDRNWSALTAVEFLPEVPELECSDDLDVGGENSLLTLLSLAGTHPGQCVLQNWIAAAPSWTEVLRRQAATKALIPARQLRLEIMRRVFNTNFAAKRPYGLAEWAQSPSWLKEHRIAHVLSYIGPALLLGGAVVLFAGRFRDDEWIMRLGFGGIALGAVTNILITVFWGSWIHDIFHRACGEHSASKQFAQIFSLLSQLPDDQGILVEARRIATEKQDCAIHGFADLNRRVRLASLQHNVVLYLVYLGLQLVLLWDFRVLRVLEKWKDRYSASVSEWFAALGRCEAVISSATLSDEHPDWCFPAKLTDSELRLEAKELGHPLLSNDKRINNDLTLRAAEPLLLVTGSNMAGKSTFMRALGLNVLLARTGSRVCAKELSTHLYEISSSIRVRDSLREGVSFFMAELRRLKTVVDKAKHHHDEDQPPILFLLDEILQGTNSRERQIAVANVVGQLVKFGTTGLLSTHDLDLAKVDEVAAVAQIVHFREYFDVDANGKQQMRFDYIMRPGPTPTTNALKLLEMVGLCERT
jgi:MutS domain V